MSVSVNLDKKLDKAFEEYDLTALLKQKPSALAGLTEKHDEVFAELGIKTINDLATNKYFALAKALADLAEHQG